MKQQSQLILFGAGSVIDDEISKVFSAKPITAKKGDKVANVGYALGIGSRKDIAERLNLKGKENKDKLDAAILAQSDEAFRVVRAQIAGLDGEWTLKKVANRIMGDGERQITVVVKHATRKVKGPTDEQLAEALSMLGQTWTVEQVREARARQEAAQNIDAQEMDAQREPTDAPGSLTGASE